MKTSEIFNEYGVVSILETYNTKTGKTTQPVSASKRASKIEYILDKMDWRMVCIDSEEYELNRKVERVLNKIYDKNKALDADGVKSIEALEGILQVLCEKAEEFEFFNSL